MTQYVLTTVIKASISLKALVYHALKTVFLVLMHKTVIHVTIPSVLSVHIMIHVRSVLKTQYMMTNPKNASA